MQSPRFEQAQASTDDRYSPSEEQSVAHFIEVMCSKVNELLAAIPEISRLPIAS